MTRGKQVLLALLSLLLLILLAMGIVWGQRFLLASTPKENYTTFKPMSKEEREKASIETATKAVEQLEKKQDDENLTLAKDLVTKLANSKSKESLLARVTLVQAKIKNKGILEEAERSVKYLEDHQELSNVSLAQDILSKVTEPRAKKALEERVRRVQEAIEGREKAVAEEALKATESSSDPARETVEATLPPATTYVQPQPQAPQPTIVPNVPVTPTVPQTQPVPSVPSDTPIVPETPIPESSIPIDPRALEPTPSLDVFSSPTN